MMQNIRLHGDAAIKDYTSKFDHAFIDQIKVSEEELLLAENEITPALAQAIRTAAENIRKPCA